MEQAAGRLAAAGGDEVAGVLMESLGAALDAPVWFARVEGERLVWASSYGDDGLALGCEAGVERTAWGRAWRSRGLVNVVRLSGDEPEDNPEPGSVLALPLQVEVPRGSDVVGVLVLTARRAGWFSETDVAAAWELVLVAGARLSGLRQGESGGDGAEEEAAGPRREVDEVSPQGALPGSDEHQRGEVEDLRSRGFADGLDEKRHGVVEELSSGEVADPRISAQAHISSPEIPGPLAGADPLASNPQDPNLLVSNLVPHADPLAAEALASNPLVCDDPPTSNALVAHPLASETPGSTPRAPADPVVSDPLASADPLGSADPAVSHPLVSYPLTPASLATAPLPKRPPFPRPAGDVIDLAACEQAARAPEADRFAGWFTPVRRPQPGRLVVPQPRRTAATARAFARRRPPAPPELRALPPAMPSADSMGLWQWDAVTGRCTWSSPVPRLLGLPAGARLTLDTLRDLLEGVERDRFELGVRAVHGGHGVAGALRIMTPDGLVKQAFVWSEVRRGPSGEFLGAWGGVVDVTAFEQDAAALRHGLAGLRAAQELTGLATWQWQPSPADGAEVDGGAARGELTWSAEMYRLAGITPGEFRPTLADWYALVHPDDLPRARRLDLDAGCVPEAPSGRERVETFRLVGPDDEIRHVQSWSATNPAAAVTGAPGAGPVVYGATIDVTRQVHDRMMLEQLLATDPVTGLGNRVAYGRRIGEMLGRVHNGPRDAVCLFLLDLDRFKVVNDSLGHQVGDRLLVEVARRLVATAPEGSVTARMGGDEFVVVPPPGLTEDAARKLAIGIVDALRAPYKLPETGELLVCPASLGVAQAGRRSVSGNDLLREADIALYQAKDSGRDRYVIFDDALRARTQVRASAERRLRRALDESALTLEYQPVVDFADGRVVGAEGLVRLRDIDGSDRLIPPHLFLDIAEQTGLVAELDAWVVETAIRQLAAWARNPARTSDLPWLSINLSARSIEHPAVVRRLVDAVKRGEVPRDRIRVELKEHSFIGGLPAAEVALRQLLANGIGVGIDDFGTGYSALPYLAHFDLDFMKIDRSFVASVGRDDRGDAVVLAIVDLAHAHGMQVVAEGVESGRQARRLREMGCDFAQGFHFGRPGPATRIVRN